MNKKMNFNVEKHVVSPIEIANWIEQGVFDYLRREEVFKETEIEKLKVAYAQKFKEYLSKVKHLIKNELDKGHVAFVLITVSFFDTLQDYDISENDIFQLTSDCINKPIYHYVLSETKKYFDSVENPFQALIEVSKNREETYFGSSFDFERPVDNEYGYILNIKKCLFYETLTVLDRRELQPILCQMDLGWINAINPEKHLMQFVRPVTFATGNTCQMWFIKKEKELKKH